MRGIFLFLFFNLFFIKSEAEFVKVEGIEKAKIIKVETGGGYIYALSDNVLFKGKDNIWRKIFISKAEPLKDFCLDNLGNVYLASSSGVYFFKDKEIKKIFNSPEEINCIAYQKGKVFVGTEEGIYLRKKGRWRKLNNLADENILSFSFRKNKVYVATKRGVYILEKNSLKRIFKGENSEEEEAIFYPFVIYTDKFHKNQIFLGTNQGIFLLYENKKAEKFLPQFSFSVKCIKAKNKNNLYLATDKGVFKIDLQKRNSIYLGFKNALWLTFNSSGRLLVATTKGLFMEEEKRKKKKEEDAISLKDLLKGEPSIEEIREHALLYNDISPKKINDWKKRVRWRALFPTISLDYDKTISYRYGSFWVGPRDWGISISWDVGDLIWNPYEDDIDVRSRLTTQLRINILDDINNLYFERLRIKKELLNPKLSPEERLKKELRLKEITASLDAYTGGYFSKRLKELKKR